MKKYLLSAILLAFFSFSNGVFASGLSLSYDFNTGDKTLDLQLNELNIQATADKDNFIKEASATFQIDKAEVSLLMEREKMEPAEVYLALRLQQITDQPLSKVVSVYKANKGKGWGVIAKELGIKPGSPEFHALKKNQGGMLPDPKGPPTKGPKSKGPHGKGGPPHKGHGGPK